MVQGGGARELDRLGNNAADEAADFGRRGVEIPVIDARRNLAGVCMRALASCGLGSAPVFHCHFPSCGEL